MTFRKQGSLFVPTRNIWVPRRSLRDNRGMVGIGIPLIGAAAASRRRTAAPTGTQVITNTSYTGRGGSFWVGFRFVPTSDLTVTELGRFIVATSAGKTRTVKIWNFNSSGSYAEICSASDISLTSGLNTYVWSSVSGSLTSGIWYIIASNERADDVTNGWANQTTLTSTAAISTISTAYQAADSPTYGGWQGGVANDGYAGVNFKYA